jgi:hypothetical protein
VTAVNDFPLIYWQSIVDLLVDYTAGDWVTASVPPPDLGDPLLPHGVQLALSGGDPVLLTADRARRLGEALVHAAEILEG